MTKRAVYLLIVLIVLLSVGAGYLALKSAADATKEKLVALEFMHECRPEANDQIAVIAMRSGRVECIITGSIEGRKRAVIERKYL